MTRTAQRFRDLRIKHKLTAVILATSTVALTLAVLAFVIYEVVSFRGERVRSMTALAKALAISSTVTISLSDAEDGEELLAGLAAVRDVLGAAMYDKDDQLLASYPSDGGDDVGLEDAPSETAGARFEPGRLRLTQPVMVEGEQIGTIVVVSDTGRMRSRLWNYALISAAIFVVCLLAATILSTKLAKLISVPIEGLATAAKKVVEKRDYSIRAEKLVGDELGLLTDAFNEMLATIEQRRRALQDAHDSLESRVEERTAELRRSNEELDSFAYVASHDLKSPLRAIRNLAQWIDEDAGESLPEESRDDLRTLRGRVTRMEGLLDSLLLYSRVGRKEDNPEAIDTTQLVDDLLATLDVPPGFTFAVDRVMPTLLAPRGALNRVFGNLISNAIKHHDREEATIQVTCRDAGEFHEFSISDDGPGIPEKFRKRMFVIFQTLKPRDELESTGMGLALVKKTVEFHGGGVTLESGINGGTTIRFTWPKSKQDTEQ